jgi:uncharacterized protein YdiU (UPF0061 family)
LGLSQDEAQKKFEPVFNDLTKYFMDAWKEVMAKKLGIFKPIPQDHDLINEFLKYMEEENLDFTNSFRELPQKLNGPEDIYQKIKKRLEDQTESLDQAISLMKSANPYIIPRNHLVEKAISMGITGDFSFFKKMVDAFRNPYQEDLKLKDFTNPPKPNEIVHQTFCGT